jgi:hypothetical protein
MFIYANLFLFRQKGFYNFLSEEKGQAKAIGKEPGIGLCSA